jgi:hypothetical protein
MKGYSEVTLCQLVALAVHLAAGSRRQSKVPRCQVSPAGSPWHKTITNQLLRTLPAIDRELNPREDPNAPAQIIFDMPGPERDRVPPSEPTYADVRT